MKLKNVIIHSLIITTGLMINKHAEDISHVKIFEGHTADCKDKLRHICDIKYSAYFTEDEIQSLEKQGIKVNRNDYSMQIPDKLVKQGGVDANYSILAKYYLKPKFIKAVTAVGLTVFDLGIFIKQLKNK